MYVKDWHKWTSAKKKAVGILYFSGIMLGFTIETAPIWWGVVGLFLCFLGALIMNTIGYHEW